MEIKGRVELDLPQKMARLKQWCEDATKASRDDGGPIYRFVFVDEDGFKKHRQADFAGLAGSFRDYQ